MNDGSLCRPGGKWPGLGTTPSGIPCVLGSPVRGGETIEIEDEYRPPACPTHIGCLPDPGPDPVQEWIPEVARSWPGSIRQYLVSGERLKWCEPIARKLKLMGVREVITYARAHDFARILQRIGVNPDLPRKERILERYSNAPKNIGPVSEQMIKWQMWRCDSVMERPW